MPRDRRPLAVRVRDDIRESIVADGLRPGQQLPTEAELVARHEVARTTVREALKLLEQDGLVHARHGVGRFVASPTVERPITRLESVTAMMGALGYQVTNRVLSVGEVELTAEPALALQVRTGTPAIRLERLRLQGDEPLIYSVDIVPRELIPDPLESIDWTGSLAALLEARGWRLASAVAALRAVALPRGVARRIGHPYEPPWLLLEQTNYTDDGRPIIRSSDYHRGDAFTFHVLRRAEPGTDRRQP